MRSVRVCRVVVAWCTATVLALGVLVIGASPSSAHAELVGSDPEDGSTVPTVPASVELTFSEAVESTGAFVGVTDPSGAEVHVREPEVVDGTVTQSTTGIGPAGTYTMAFRVVSADGHPISDELTFTVESDSQAQDAGGSEQKAVPEQTPEHGPEHDAAPTATDDISTEEGFVSRHATSLGLGVIGLLAVGMLVGVGVRGRHVQD